MIEPRVLLAGVLGIGLGLVMVAFPDAVIRAQTAGRLPTDRGGGYGEDAESGRWRVIVRVLGGAAIVFGVGLLWRAVA